MDKEIGLGHQEMEKSFEKPSFYNFGLVDPRPIPIAKQNNEILFSKTKVGILGIEMTIPEYLKRCNFGNIDPQHSGHNVGKAAIDIAVSYPLPDDGVLMITVRPDLDSIGTMALIDLRRKGLKLNTDLLYRVKNVSDSDIFANGDWKPKPLPSRDNVWAGVERQNLSAISLAVSDFKLSILERVKLMEEWLDTGNETVFYRNRVQDNRLQLVKMLEKGEIKYETINNGKITLVTSTSTSGTSIGYSLSPVVVVTNPSFVFEGNEPVIKHTICQYKVGYIDLPAILKDLNEIETGWGGSNTIIGSPQGTSSKITQEQISKIVVNHLL